MRLGWGDLAICGIMALGTATLFLLDVSRSESFAGEALYCTILVLSLRFGRPAVLGTAVLTTLLTVISASFDANGMTEAIGQRGMAILAIWSVAVIIAGPCAQDMLMRASDAERRHQAALGRIIKGVLQTEKRVEDRLRFLTETGAEAMRADTCSVLQWQPADNTARVLDKWRRRDGRHLGSQDVPLNGGGRQIEIEFVSAIDDVRESPRHLAWKDLLEANSVRALLTANAPYCGHSPGAVVFDFAKPHRWTTSEIEFGKAVGGIASVLLSTSRVLEVPTASAQVRDGVQNVNGSMRDETADSASTPPTGSNAEIGEFTQFIAHDLANALGVIRQFADLLLHDLQHRSRERGFAERIARTCTVAAELVQRIFMFGLSETIQQNILDLGALLESDRANLWGLPQAGVTVRVTSPAEPLLVLGNDAQIVQLIFNLYLNARDACKDTEGEIAISLERVSPEALEELMDWKSRPNERGFGILRKERSYCRLQVTDNGRGIAGENLDHVFEPFFTTKNYGRGAGLGLAIVRRVVEAHDAICHLRSSSGQGAQFNILWPLVGSAERDARPSPSAGEQHMRASPNLRGTERVLVVGPDDKAGEIANGLDRYGYRAAVANDPVEAIDAVREDPRAFDIVVFTVAPTEPKIEELRLIAPAMKVVLVAEPINGATAAACPGIDTVIMQPVGAELLCAGIRELMGMRD